MRPHARAVLVVLLAVVALLAAAVPAGAQEPTTLIVVESASVQAAPDAAAVRVQVRRTAVTSAAARRAAERRVRALVAALAGLGIPAADLRTQEIESYSVRRRGKRVHIAVRGMNVHVADLAKLEPVLTALGGAVSGGPDFIVSDPTEERQAATQIALQRARARADSAAAALGMRVTATLRVDLNPELGYDVEATGGRDESEDAASGGGAVTVEPGTNEIAVAVAVVYAIGP